MGTGRLKEGDIKPITVHDLRRTVCTKLIRRGVPLPTVQRLLGHSTVQTMLKHYTGIDDSDLRAAVKKLGNLA